MKRKEAFGKAVEQLIGDDTQAAIAKRAGITETEVSLYKTAQRYPQDKNREKLAKGLGCTLGQLDGLEWQYRTGAVDPGEVQFKGKYVILADGEKIHDPELRRILEEASMASRHAAALTDSINNVTRQLVAYLNRQVAAEKEAAEQEAAAEEAAAEEAAEGDPPQKTSRRRK